MIGRPEKTETGTYYFNYIDRVAGDDVLRVIEDQLEEALSVLSEISEARSTARTISIRLW